MAISLTLTAVNQGSPLTNLGDLYAVAGAPITADNGNYNLNKNSDRVRLNWLLKKYSGKIGN